VGSYMGSASPVGTFDQGGNVHEWNEAFADGPYRSLRGGSYIDRAAVLATSYRYSQNPPIKEAVTGFRVAMIPEPSTALLVACGLVGLAARRRRG
jgi:sulfatase modifying factor 1